MKLNEMTNQTIMTALEKTNQFNWLNSTNATYLDYEFYLNHSGEKETSPIIDILLAKGKTEDEVLTIIANICVSKYGKKWNRLYETLHTENYSIFKDYDVKITRKGDENASVSSEGNANSGIYGFNSEQAVPSGTSDTSSTLTKNKAQNTTSSEETRSGKIGNLTYQEMAKKEISLRLDINFLEIVLNDVSSEMCISIY